MTRPGSPRPLALREVELRDIPVACGVLLAFPSPPSRSAGNGPGSGSQADSARAKPHLLGDLLSATARRFAAFCAEASVLVLVLGILDRFLMQQRIEARWIAGSFAISLALLIVSIATDVVSRWLTVQQFDATAE